MWALIITHFGNNWGLYTTLTLMPTYFQKILLMDIKHVLLKVLKRQFIVSTAQVQKTNQWYAFELNINFISECLLFRLFQRLKNIYHKVI